MRVCLLRRGRCGGATWNERTEDKRVTLRLRLLKVEQRCKNRLFFRGPPLKLIWISERRFTAVSWKHEEDEKLFLPDKTSPDVSDKKLIPFCWNKWKCVEGNFPNSWFQNQEVSQLRSGIGRKLVASASIALISCPVVWEKSSSWRRVNRWRRRKKGGSEGRQDWRAERRKWE